jgi:hypothetical protein
MGRTENGSPYPASGSELQAVVAAERAGRPFLMLRTADGEHRLVTFADEPSVLTVGRRGANDIVLGWDERVSRVHARLERFGGEWTVVDDGISRNGTFVNGDRATTRVRLQDGDAVRVGGTLIVFRDPGDRSGAMTAAADLAVAPQALTEMQRKVLIALCRPYKQGAGLVTPATNTEIAAELFLSVDAVKTHLRSLFQKFGVGELPQNQKRLRVVECAFQWGLVTERDL